MSDEKKEWLSHVQHRLTLLRTFRDRLKEGPIEGDFHRCCKDSALISIRLLAEAMGLSLDKDQTKIEKRRRGGKHADDVWFEDIGGCSVEPDKLTDEERTLLFRMFFRANKELAHLTKTQDKQYNRRERMVAAIDLVERLVEEHFYKKIGDTMPSTHADRPPVSKEW